MDKKILLLLFLVSGFAFSQTTVTLQDQCNCEVLSGTAVTSPGTTTPSGADTGDIYVNTNTGVIYFWDGDSWELTSSDDQLLQNFSFNSGTNILSLDIEDGNTVNVDLSSLSGTGTDDQLISLAGNILTLEDGGTVDLTPYLDNTDDQTITAFSIDASNILTLTLEDGNTQTVDLSGLVGTDDQTAAEVTYDNTASGLTATDVQVAIDEINALAGTVALVDNGDGTYDFTDAAGNTTIITDTSISTLVDNADGTYTYTDESGVTQLIDTNASSNPYDNTTSGLTATDVQAAIDEINALAGTVALVDNGDGTYDFTDAAGNTTIITDTSISTLVDNADGTYTYTDESGVTQLIDTNASSNPYDNTASGLTATDVQAAIDEINALAGTVALIDNGDGTYDFTDAAGNTTIITDTSISTLVDNADGTYTYTDESGVTQLIDTNASSNPYDNTASGLTATDVQAAIDEINALAGTVALIDNGDGTYDFTDTAGNTTIITDTSISTLVDNADGTYTYTDESGVTQLIDTNASSNPYDNTASGLTATDVQAAIDEINALAGTVALIDNGDGTYDFTDAAGNTTIITDTSISTLVDNADGTYTYTDESGVTQLIDTNASSNPYDNTASGLTATDVQAAIDEINALAGTVALVDNGDGTYDFTDAAGNTTIITDTSISTLVDNVDGTYTYTDESGVTQLIDTNASSNPYDNTASGLTATDVQAAIDEINALAGTVALVDNGDGTYDFTDAAGNTTIITDTSISTMVDNADGTYTYTDESGVTQLIDTNASSNPYDNTTSGLTATDVQAAIDEINALAGTVALVDNGDGTYDFTDAAGNTTIITDTSISTLVDNADGTYTYTDESGVIQLIDTNASSNPYDNTASGLTATDVQAAIDEINALAGTVALVDNGDGTYDFTDAAGNTTVITDTSISTLVDNGDGSFTYTDETGATTIFTETLTTLVDNFNGTFTYTNEDGVAQIVSKSDIIDNFDGTYVFNNNDGSPETIDTRAISNPYDNTASGLTATDVQAAIDEINALAGTVALVDNGDGTYDFTDAAGNTTIITDTSISTLVDNADGTYTYTDESGVTQLIDTNASSNPYDNTASGLTATDVQAAIDEINALAGTVALVDNGDGTYDFTDAAGNTTIITDTSISTMVDNADGTYTYTDESGVTQLIDTNASSNPYDNTASGLTATDVQAALDELAAGSTDDQNISGSGLAGTDLTIGIENGTSEVVDLSSLVESVIAGTGAISVTDDGNGNYTVNSTDPDEDLTNELTLLGGGAPVVVPSNPGVTYVDTVAGQLYVWDGAVWNVVGGNASPDLDGDPANELNTTFAVNAGNLEITDNGGTLAVPLASLGTDDQTAAEVTYDNTTSGLTAIDVQDALDELAAGSTDDQTISTDGTAGNISIEDGNTIAINVNDADADPTNEYNTGISFDGTNLTVTDAGGNQVVDISGVSTDDQNLTGASLSGANILQIDIENGASTTVDLSALDDPGTDDQTAVEVTYDNTVSGLTAIDVQAALDELAAGSTDDQTISTDGSAGNISIEDGNTIAINVNDADADATNEFNTGISFDGTNLTVTDAGGNQVVDISGVSTDDQNISGSGLAGTDLTIGIENGANEVVDLSSLVETVVAGTGAITVTDDGNGNYTVNSTDPDEDLTNELTLIGAGAPAVVPSNAGVTYVDSVAGQLYIWDGAAWNAVGGNASPDLDGDPTNEYNTGISFDGTNLTVTDAGGNQVVDISGVSTDDQNIESLAVDAGTNILTVGIENGTSQTVDLSHLDDAGTDDQTAAEVTYDNTISGLTATDVKAALDEVAAGSTDDQNISGSGLAGNILTIGIENGTNETVDLSALVGTDDQIANEVNITDAGGNFVSTEVEGALAELAAGSTDDQNISGSGLAGNILTIGIENGTNETVDLSTLVGSDDQNLTLAANSLSIEDGNSVDLSPYLDNTDDQNIESLAVDAGTNILTVGIENGTSQTVDLSHLDDTGTDDQTAAEVTYDNTTSGLTAIDVQDALDELAAGSTDDQTISTDGTAGNISIEDGNTIAINVNDADADATNEYNTGISFDGTNLTVTDAGGNQVVDISGVSTDDQNISGSGLAGTDLTIGIENGTNEVVDLSSLVETVVAGTGAITVTDDGNGNYTVNSTDPDEDLTNELTLIGAGAPAVVPSNAGVTYVDSIAGQLYIWDGATWNAVGGSASPDLDGDPTNEYNTGISFDGTNLTVTDAGGNQVVDISGVSTDDQNISGSGLAGNILTIGIENGTNETVDLSALVGTDDQIANEVNITDAGGNFVATEVEGALAELAAGSTDDQNISGSGLTGNILTIGIENGTNETVDLSALVGTDDQIANEVNITDAGGNFVATEVEGALAELAAGSTDDQNISGSGLAGNILTIGIENGTNETVDLSALVGTDDQIANEVNITDAGGNFVATEVEGALAELAAGSTDDQNISGSGLAGNILTIGIENGTNETVDLSALVGTDDQNLTGASLSGANVLQIDIENGTSTTVDLSSLDNSGTDDQNISGSGLAGNILTIGIENGTNETVDLSALVGTDDQIANEVNITDAGGNFVATEVEGALAELAAGSTDDQNISGSGLAGNILTIGIENGTNETVDLSALVGTDDQIANEVNITDAGGNFVATEVEGALAELAAGSTDDQNISGSGLAGNILTIGIENGTNETVDLSALVGTDDQNLTGASLSGANVLQIDIENGTSTTVDLSSLDNSGTDDQIASEVNITDAGGNFVATEVEGALAELAAGSTDDQNISGSGLAGNILTIGIENGTNETVDLSALVGTDDQNLTGASLSGANVLQIDIENGTSTTVDLSSLDNSGTDDQIASEVNITDAGGNFVATEVEGALAELAAGSTDDQNISGSGLAGNILTIGIENGTNETVDLSALVGTDDQTAAEVTYDNTASGLTATDVKAAIDEVAAGSTDDQNISGSGLAGNILTIGIENGTNETVDLSALVGTDDQIANEVNITDAGGNFVSTEVEGALAELAAGSTDDQNISGSGLAGNILTIGIENGTNETVDLSALVGTDDQTAAEVTYDNTASGLTATDVKAAIDEVAAGSTDDQNISGSGLAGNILTIGIENGTNETVDLSALVGTDDQNLTGASLSGANVLQIDIENGTSTTVDLSSLDNSGTDDQIASEVNITDAGGNFVATEVEGALAELAAGSTDDQNISGSGLAGNILTIGIENGANETVDLSALVGTDDQNIESLAVDAGTNILTVGIENGTSQTVDLSHLDDAGTDDQTAAEVTYDNTISGLTATDVKAALDEVAAGSTDDQYDDEVLLRTPIDVDEGGVGSPTNETTVEEVIQAIAPITSKAARIFYPPSIAVDASTNGSFSIDLYAQYTAQFGTPTVASAGAPAAVPTYGATELYYYVTYADPTVFNTATMAIDGNGVLSYDIIGQPSDYNSLINVVFVVK